MPENIIVEQWNLNVRAGVFISALPNDVIEDVTLSNIHLIAPGGGTPEEAVRTYGHAEMYDYWHMYPEHLQNIGDFPGAVVYLRNASNVRFTDCILECRRSDARAAVAAECVDGLRMRDVEIRNCAALLRHYRCDGLRVTDCDAALLPFDEHQAHNWEQFRELSLLVDGILEEMAHTVETVLSMETTASFDTPIFDLEADPERKQYLLITKSLGNFDLYVNGECVGGWKMPSCYVTPYPFAFCLSDVMTKGSNRISLRPQGQFELSGQLLIKA